MNQEQKEFVLSKNKEGEKEWHSCLENQPLKK